VHYFSYITEDQVVYYALHHSSTCAFLNDNPDGQKICVTKYRVQQLGYGSDNFPIGTYKPLRMTLYKTCKDFKSVNNSITNDAVQKKSHNI